MSDAITNLNLDFSNSPTIWNFLNDNSFVRGIMGPVGSGKSYAIVNNYIKQQILVRYLK